MVIYKRGLVGVLIPFLGLIIPSGAFAVDEAPNVLMSGVLCNVVHTPTDIRKWGINVYDLNAGTSRSVFGIANNRKIQSVACSYTGNVIIFSMQESPRSKYEIYALLNGSKEVLQLTDNEQDDLHVTLNRQGTVASWQTELSDGRQAININQLKLDGSYRLTKHLVSAYPFLQPSLSQNGEWLTFIQLRANNYSVLRYQVATEAFTEIRRVPRRNRISNPSISDDGNFVGWTEGRQSNRYIVKDVLSQTSHQIVTNEHGIEHPMLSGEGGSLIFSVNEADGDRQSYLASLWAEPQQIIPIGAALSGPDRYLASFYSNSLYQPLNDTGITRCVDTQDWWSLPDDCAAHPNQDQAHGRDVTLNDDTDGVAGFTYTKLDEHGKALASAASDWSCVRDDVSGLVWEIKAGMNNRVGDQGLHDSDDRFTWYSTKADTNAGSEGHANSQGDDCSGYEATDPSTYCNTEAYVARVNQAGYCGISSWRLPSRHEVISTLNYGNKNAAVDLNYFNDVNTLVTDLHIWSADSNSADAEGAWNIDFYNGNYFIYPKRAAHSIRLVSETR